MVHIIVDQYKLLCKINSVILNQPQRDSVVVRLSKMLRPENETDPRLDLNKMCPLYLNFITAEKGGGGGGGLYS